MLNKKISNLIALIILISSCTYWHSVNLKYMIPKGYEGMIMIGWDQKDGIPKSMEGDYEAYTIPPNGFLKSQVASRSLAPIDEKFYSYDLKTGKRTELEMIYPDISADTITKDNQYYIVGSFSSGHGETGNMVFFITRDKKSKFMDSAYREKYFFQHEDALYEGY